MATKKESTLTTTKDTQYVRGLDGDGKSIRILKSDLAEVLADVMRTASTNKKGLMPADFLGGIEVNTYAAFQDGSNYASYKYVGQSATDGPASVLLICPIAGLASPTETFRGVTGRFFFYRGHVGASLTVTVSDVILAKAYNRVVGTQNTMGTFSLTLGHCDYDGNTYLAIKFPSLSYFGTAFSGVYSKNCIFKSVALTNVTWLGDIS